MALEFIRNGFIGNSGFFFAENKSLGGNKAECWRETMKNAKRLTIKFIGRRTTSFFPSAKLRKENFVTLKHSTVLLLLLGRREKKFDYKLCRSFFIENYYAWKLEKGFYHKSE